MLPNFDLARPRTTEKAAALVNFDSMPYVGGTELLLAMKMGLLQPERLVDLKRIPELHQIEVREKTLIIGAAATHRQIASDPLVSHYAPLLAEVENRVGNVRVRASGSIGGNLCFAEPKSDIATILIALDAVAMLKSPRGQRQLAIDEFILGAYTTAREEDELLTAIHIPLEPAHTGVYLKYQTMERPTLGVGLVWRGDRWTLVVGAVAERPMRFDFAAGDSIDPQQIAEIVQPLPDLTGSVSYKRHLVAVYVRMALDQLEAVS
jgi:carbon-monoxide dehydrogenase medium subunit